jgi:hypothetical protein
MAWFAKRRTMLTAMKKPTRQLICTIAHAAFAVLFTGCALAPPPVPPSAQLAPPPALQQLRADAQAVAPFATSAPAREFLDAVAFLPPQPPRDVYVNKALRQTLSPAQHQLLSAEARVGFERVVHDEAFYYATFYGTPVAYVRPLDIASQHGLRSLVGARVLDLGYGAIGAVRMMAAAGAQVSALDVDSLLPALYREPSDQGVVRGNTAGLDSRAGSLTLFNGVFAGDPALTQTVGRDHDLIVSKNTLKRGFMKSTGGRKPWVDFGVPDATLLTALHRALKPGGLLVIYNLAGKLDPTKPSTDGRSPFDRAAFEAAGFEVLALDATDDPSARAMGQALGWQKDMGELSENLFALVTVVRAQVAAR